MAFVEFLTPLPSAPYEFAENVLVRFGSFLAPASLTQEGKPSVPMEKFACADTGEAAAAAEARAKPQINLKRLLRELFFI